MATHGIYLSCISQFNPNTDTASVSQQWKDWLKRFQRFIVAMDIKDGTRKCNLLLYLAGPEVDKIFETLPETGQEKDFELAVKKLNEYFAQKKNRCHMKFTYFAKRSEFRKNLRYILHTIMPVSSNM